MIERLSGDRPAGAAFDAAARDLREDRATLRPLGEALLGRLVELGFVVPAS